MKEYTRYGRFIRTNAEYLEDAYGSHNAILIYVHTDTAKTPDIVGKWFANTLKGKLNTLHRFGQIATLLFIVMMTR